LKIYNRGISGNKVPDLERRWQADTLDLKPALLSILIGVNDIWHKLNGKYDGTPESYRDGFAALLEKTRQALPKLTLVVCEPFVLRCGAVNDKWFPEFEQRRAFAREVADGAGALWVPFQEMFDDAVAAGTAPEFWARDGVHPTVAGHALMARKWRQVVGL
jgi:lysophospholipase L1-like esterase